MQIEIVNPAQWMPEIYDLIAANWDETGMDFPFDPDVEIYARMADAGMVFAVAAFDDTREIVGYCTVMVTPHPHNMRVIFASNDALFVRKDLRNTLLSGRIILTAEREAKARGAKWFMWHCRGGTPLAAMLEKHGYDPIDIVVGKEL